MSSQAAMQSNIEDLQKEVADWKREVADYKMMALFLYKHAE